MGKREGRAGELGAEGYSAADDRVRGEIESASSHVLQLQGEVLRLQARIEVLEGHIRKGSQKDEPPDNVE